MDMTETLSVRALLLGERLETRGLERDDTLATNPFTLRVGRQGTAFLFRYGVAVFARLSAIEEDEILRSLRARVHDPLKIPETDQLQVRVNPAGEDQIEPTGVVSLADASLERLQIIANVLSKSLVLGHSEASIAGVFDRIEPLAVGLQRKGRPGAQARELLRQIGDVLLTQHRMVGRVEVEEKPDVLWDHPELERLYARLEDEYELVERSRAMERKLALISETAGTLIELVHNQRSLRLEWYIIGLIGLELLLSLYGLMRGGLPLAAGSH
jgi:uncharacterized Rmd1/YagE family protein